MASSKVAGLVLVGTLMGMILFYLSFASQGSSLRHLVSHTTAELMAPFEEQQVDDAKEVDDTGSRRGRPDHPRIPKLIHQTYRSSDLPEDLLQFQATWKDLNPEWTYKLYNDTEAEHFVATELPEYLEAYLALPHAVERADFFRYMVVYKFGGLYSDSDTHLVTPLDDWVNPLARMVVGWERKFPTMEEAKANDYVRQNQILQWAFMAAPGHPALKDLCDSIAAHATDPELNPSDDPRVANTIILERTGPGAFTDAVLKWFQQGVKVTAATHDSSERSYWVDILPEVAMGTLHEEQWKDDGVRVVHHFAGSWKRAAQPSPEDIALRALSIVQPWDRNADGLYAWNNSHLFVTAAEWEGFLPRWYNDYHRSFGRSATFAIPYGHVVNCEAMLVNITCNANSTQTRMPDGRWSCDFVAKDVTVGFMDELKGREVAAMPVFEPCRYDMKCKIQNWAFMCYDPYAPPSPSPPPPPWKVPPPKNPPPPPRQPHPPSPPPWTIPPPPPSPPPWSTPPRSTLRWLPTLKESEVSMALSDTALVEATVSFADLDIEAFNEEDFDTQFRKDFTAKVAAAADKDLKFVRIVNIWAGSTKVKFKTVFYPPSLIAYTNGEALSSHDASASFRDKLRKDVGSIFADDAMFATYGTVSTVDVETLVKANGMPGTASNPDITDEEQMLEDDLADHYPDMAMHMIYPPPAPPPEQPAPSPPASESAETEPTHTEDAVSNEGDGQGLSPNPLTLPSSSSPPEAADSSSEPTSESATAAADQAAPVAPSASPAEEAPAEPVTAPPENVGTSDEARDQQTDSDTDFMSQMTDSSHLLAIAIGITCGLVFGGLIMFLSLRCTGKSNTSEDTEGALTRRGSVKGYKTF